MPACGPQFPLVNDAHFQFRDHGVGSSEYQHTSQHGEYAVEHTFHSHDQGKTGYGIIRVKHASRKGGNPWDEDVDRFGNTEPGTVASLKYDLDTMPRATSLRPQPLTHTEYISVHDDHRGKGLTHLMQDTLQRAHPGAPNIASNELTHAGSAWREHLATTLRDPGMGQRIGWYTSENEQTQEHRVFRPAPGQRPAALHDAGDFYVGDHKEEFDDNRVAKPKKKPPLTDEEKAGLPW